MFVRLVKKFSRITRPTAKFILSFYYDKRYLNGRHFDQSFLGFHWAIKSVWQKNILRLGEPMPWPTALTFRVSNPKNITFDCDDLNIFQSAGVYMQNFSAHITLGKGVYVAPNVGIITANHTPGNLDLHEAGKSVIIGAESWIGMNSVVLPGVILGENTIVAAGSVVTKSFLMGNVVIGGVPAVVIKKLPLKKMSNLI